MEEAATNKKNNGNGGGHDDDTRRPNNNQKSSLLGRQVGYGTQDQEEEEDMLTEAETDSQCQPSPSPLPSGSGSERVVMKKSFSLSRSLSRSLSSIIERVDDGPHRSLLGILLIMLGSFMFSCMFLLVKLMEGTADTFTISFYRALVEIPVALWMAKYVYDEDPLGPPSARGWLLVRGGTGAAAVLCFFYAIQHLPLPDAVTLQFTTPPFAAAFAVVVVGERWMKIDVIGAAFCLGGVVLIAHPSWLFGQEEQEQDGDDPSATTTDYGAVAVSLLGAALAGLAYTSVRRIGDAASANVMVLYYGVLSVPAILLGSKLLRGRWDVWRIHGTDDVDDVDDATEAHDDAFSPLDAFLMVLTGLTAYAGQYLVNLGLQRETAATGTLATCTQIVWTYAFELAFLHEPLSLYSLAGTVLIVGFMAAVGIVKMRTKDEVVVRETAVAGEPEEIALLFAAERGARGAGNS